MSTSISNVIQKKETMKEKATNDTCFSENGKTSWKSYGILAILFLIITSDVFVDNILCMFSSAVSGRSITLMGAIISAIILIIAHILIMSQLDIS